MIPCVVGSRTVVALMAALVWALNAGAVSAAAATTAPARVPLNAASPWPEMRHDSRNTGNSPIVARYHGDRPWAFQTARGVFSTPVIGGDGTIYIGSGDGYMYALRSDGRLRWKLGAGGLIDAAGALSAYDPRLGSAPLTFGSASDKLYHVTTPTRGRPRILWTYRASVPPVPGQGVDWWEGGVAVGPGGVLYAGNTGGTAYAVRPDATRLWTFTAGNSVWTMPAFAGDGSSFWGSLDLNVYRLSNTGAVLWKTFVPGYVVSSPAIGSNGTVYVGSFDSRLYALNPATGAISWSYKTSDHIYSSPALGQNAHGHTDAIYFASANGSVYALTPAGKLIWRSDTGAPVRSSPVLGRAPGGGEIAYVGSSNGKLYAFDAATGRLRWSYNTTPSNPYLAVRNNLNGSPALGRTGIYIGSQAGMVDYVPYDYCLHRRDPRCATSRGPALAATVDRIFPVDVGGNIVASHSVTRVPAATVINLRLVVRRRGQTINAAILDPSAAVHARPAFPFTVQESGDGQYLYVLPHGLLKPDSLYRLRVAGSYTDNGTNMGNLDSHGRVAGSFSTTVSFRTAAVPARMPLVRGRNAVSAITISRLSVPMPSFLASVNQIGFDSYDWIASTIARTRRTVLLWVIGATRGTDGRELVQSRSPFAFALFGRYAGGSVDLSSPNVPLQFSFGQVPLRQFELRGELEPDLRFAPESSLYADTVCASVPTYGAELEFSGLCNPQGVLATSGTFLGSAYRGTANVRPAGVRAGAVTLVRPTARHAGLASVRLSGASLPSSAHHVAAILLTDAATDVPIALDYQAATSLRINAGGAITGVGLTIPAGTKLPRRILAYVILDAFPIGRTRL
jgi:outer membrane protein assembly factor BamB